MIYEPREDSHMLSNEVRKLAYGKVLDVGTGSGVQAKAAMENENVKEVFAVDIQEEVIDEVAGQGVSCAVSDLFSNVKGKYDTIIFNPPYLPKEDGYDDVTLDGGKHGYEVLVRFIGDVADHLNADGIVLVVFSSLTNRAKVDEAVSASLLESELLSEKHISFEDLYVYKITKTELLKRIEAKGVSRLRFLAKGHRGIVFRARFRGKNVALKISNPGSRAVGRIRHEANMLGRLNRSNIGPELMCSDDEFLVMDLVRGRPILEFFRDCGRDEIAGVLADVMEQLFVMDKEGIAKEEMHRPVKHIIVGSRPVMIDFERAHYSRKPRNVSQFMQFITGSEELRKKGFELDRKALAELVRDYQKDLSRSSFSAIMKFLGLDNRNI